MEKRSVGTVSIVFGHILTKTEKENLLLYSLTINEISCCIVGCCMTCISCCIVGCCISCCILCCCISCYIVGCMNNCSSGGCLGGCMGVSLVGVRMFLHHLQRQFLNQIWD